MIVVSLDGFRWDYLDRPTAVRLRGPGSIRQWAGLAAPGLLDRTNLVVVSDHGMTAISPDRVIFLDDYVALQPGDDRVQLDGRDTGYLPANELRRNFGVVPEETQLYSGTIYDNLLMAEPSATFDNLVAACRQAEIHAVIEALPQGYRTVIGERGVGLSGGQKQRIAIARALLKKPKILIFDEATSNVDQETAYSLARTINSLKGRATIVFISHQLPKGLAVDEVLRFGG